MRVKLGDVCERGTSNLKLSDVSEKNGEFSVFGASGYIGSVDFYQQGYPYVAVVKDGAGIGRAMLCPGKTSVIGTMQYLLPKDNILPKYLFYVVKYMNLEKYFTGATIPHIYFKDYKNEEFNFDFWERQVEIVSVLSKCEKVIDLCKQELQLLDKLIKPDLSNCLVIRFQILTVYQKLHYLTWENLVEEYLNIDQEMILSC